MNCGNVNVSSDNYVQLMNCPASSISVERSFSLLRKLLTKEKTFKEENLIKYMFLYYNKDN